MQTGLESKTILSRLSEFFKAMPGFFASNLRKIIKAKLQVLLYFMIGIAVYGKLEGWSPIDASYFMTVTSTTVGYGDFCPASNAGKLFTVFYAVIGTTLIINYLLPLVEAILNPIRSFLQKKIELSVDTRDLNLSLAEVNKQISYPKRYLRACIGPVFLSFFGVLYANFALHYNPIDSLYWSMITMTTIGFGDIAPNSPMTKIFAIVYLPLAVTALADALAAISAIKVRRAIRDTKNLLQSEEEILLKESKGDPNHKVTEAEFLIDVLVENGVVDEETCIAVRRRFSAMVRGEDASVETDDNKKSEIVLDSRVVYDALKRKGALDGKDGDGTYEEWFESSWKKKVAAAM